MLPVSVDGQGAHNAPVAWPFTDNPALARPFLVTGVIASLPLFWGPVNMGATT
jgi:hypothetical protein